MLWVSELHPQRSRRENGVRTPALKRTALGADSRSLESLEDTGSSEGQGANHPVQGRDTGNMNTHGSLQANH